MCKNKTSSWWVWLFFQEVHSHGPEVPLLSHPSAAGTARAVSTQGLALIPAVGGEKGPLRFAPSLPKSSSWHGECWRDNCGSSLPGCPGAVSGHGCTCTGPTWLESLKSRETSPSAPWEASSGVRHGWPR